MVYFKKMATQDTKIRPSAVAPSNKGRDSVCVIIDLLRPSSQPPIHHHGPLQPRLPSVKLSQELMVQPRSGRMRMLRSPG